MLNIEAYDINFKKLTEKAYCFEYELNEAFFRLLNDVEISEGMVSAKVHINHLQDYYNLVVEVNGCVFVPCDRCLDDMQQEIVGNCEFLVKFGKENGENDDIIYISEESGVLNIAWLMYETIALHIPMIHSHSDEKECNTDMMNKLHNHITYEVDAEMNEDENQENNRQIDLRWEGLKNIITN